MVSDMMNLQGYLNTPRPAPGTRSDLEKATNGTPSSSLPAYGARTQTVCRLSNLVLLQHPHLLGRRRSFKPPQCVQIHQQYSRLPTRDGQLGHTVVSIPFPLSTLLRSKRMRMRMEKIYGNTSIRCFKEDPLNRPRTAFAVAQIQFDDSIWKGH